MAVHAQLPVVETSKEKVPPPLPTVALPGVKSMWQGFAGWTIEYT